MFPRTLVSTAVLLACSSPAAFAQTPKGKPILLSADPDGSATAQPSGRPAVSDDGRFVAFRTRALSMLGMADSPIYQVVLLDRESGEFELASRDVSDGTVNGDCLGVRISANGRYVYYATTASDVIPGDASSDYDIFRYDRQTDDTVLVSRADSGAQANDDCFEFDVSPDGRYVVFTTDATNLAADANGFDQIYLRDMTLDFTRLVSRNVSDQPASQDCHSPAVSADGQRIVFVTFAPNFFDQQAGTNIDNVWLRDLTTDATTLISKPLHDTAAPNAFSIGPTISPDGRFVAYSTQATNLVPGDPAATLYRVILFDREKSKATRLKLDLPGLVDNGFDGLRLSYGAKHLVFRSSETTDDGQDDAIGLWTRATKKVTLVSRTLSGGVPNDANNSSPFLTTDGRFVAFDSTSPELAADANATRDVFLFRRG